MMRLRLAVAAIVLACSEQKYPQGNLPPLELVSCSLCVRGTSESCYEWRSSSCFERGAVPDDQVTPPIPAPVPDPASVNLSCDVTCTRLDGSTYCGFALVDTDGNWSQHCGVFEGKPGHFYVEQKRDEDWVE